MLIDIHRHAKDNGSADVVLRNLFHLQFNEIEKNRWYSIGLHPWHVKEKSLTDDLNKITEAANHPQVIAIGEAGLDKAIDVPLHIQAKAFEAQIEIAVKVNKPMIIHCVRSYNEVFETKLRMKHKKPWIMHWFNASREMALQLVDKNFFLSFGHMLFNEKSKACKAFLFVSPDKIFFETDDTNYSIDEVYMRAAYLRNIELSKLQKQIKQNFTHCFGIRL